MLLVVMASGLGIGDRAWAGDLFKRTYQVVPAPTAYYPATVQMAPVPTLAPSAYYAAPAPAAYYAAPAPAASWVLAPAAAPKHHKAAIAGYYYPAGAPTTYMVAAGSASASLAPRSGLAPAVASAPSGARLDADRRIQILKNLRDEYALYKSVDLEASRIKARLREEAVKLVSEALNTSGELPAPDRDDAYQLAALAAGEKGDAELPETATATANAAAPAGYYIFQAPTVVPAPAPTAAYYLVPAPHHGLFHK